MRNKLFLFILGLCFSVAAFAQTRTVSGVVTSADDNSPLLGATVRVPGTGAGAITDIDGRFVIEVPDGSNQLQVSYVGYETQAIDITGQSTANVSMNVESNLLDVVTITPYGKDGATPIPGATTLIDVEEVEGVPIASFEQILQGKAPGLTILSGSGQPGTAATVKIRGTNSIQGDTDPLYILDGQPLEPNEFASINPDDFAVVGILKDAASTAIYGSRATNGVILLKTKTGKAGKTRVNYSGQYGFSNPGRQEFDMMNAQELLAFQQIAGRGAGWTLSPAANPTASPTELAANAAELARLNATDNDFRDIFFRTGKTNSHNLSFSGGKEDTRFFASVGFYDEEGIGVRTGIERKTARFNFNHDISDRFRLTIKSSVGNAVSSFTESENSISLANHAYGGSLVSQGNQGRLTETTANLKNITTVQTLNYLREFGTDHLGAITLGYEHLNREYLQNSFTGYDLNPLYPGITPNQIEYTNAAGESVAAISGRRTRNQLSSGFAIGSYTFKDRYTLGATFRQDASSRFGPNNKEARFWSVSGRWDVMGEEFMANSNAFDLLRLRASYGTTGNQSLAPNITTDGNNFPYFPTINSGTSFGEAVLSNGGLPNPDLQWETAKKTDIGIDFGLFDRINGSLDVYNTVTEDLFIQSAISGTTGQYTYFPFNAGSLRNRGVELEINADVIKGTKLNWNIGANIAYNDNEILDLGGESEFVSGTSIVRVGEELGAHYIEGWAGVDPATGDPLYIAEGGGITRDFNLTTPTTGWGSSNPPWVGGVNTSVAFGNFNVFAQFNFAAEYARFNNQTFFQENPNFAQFNLSRIMNTVWQNPGDVTEIQRIGTNREFSSKDIERADFIRFRNLNASYKLPESFVGRIPALSNASIFVNGTNLFTWTQFTGFDPEDSNNIAGYEYPLPRQLTAGIKLGL